VNFVDLTDDQVRPILARGVRLQTDATTGEPVLLFPEGAIYLSPSAHDIVARCDGQTTAAALLAALAEEYEADPETLRRDVWDCLTDLQERKVVVFAK
jgi:pyrroloquinoline quinone biosynthesis protein D